MIWSDIWSWAGLCCVMLGLYALHPALFLIAVGIVILATANVI